MKNIIIFLLLLISTITVKADDVKSDGLSNSEKKAVEAIAEYWKANNKGKKLTKESLMSVMDEMTDHMDLRDLVAKQVKIKDFERIEYLESESMPSWTSFLIDGREIVFVRNDKKYMITDAIDVEKGTSISNALEKIIQTKRLKKIKSLDENSFIIYPAIGNEKAVITIFADSQLPYTAKFHDGVPKLNKKGITVRYSYYIGGDSENTRAMAVVWNLEKNSDRQVVWDTLIELDRNSSSYVSTKELLDKVSKNTGIAIADKPTDKTLEITSKSANVAFYTGITGTPHVVFDDGHSRSGYFEPDKLIKYMRERGVLKE